MRIGFACEWSRPRGKTWSHIPSSLFDALQRLPDTDVLDISGQIPSLILKALKLASIRYQPNLRSFSTQVMFSALHSLLVERTMMKEIAKKKPEAVISIFDYLTEPGLPQYIYYDLCVAELRRVLADPLQGRYERVRYAPRVLGRRERYQRDVYENAAGLFAMSEYAALTAREYYGVDPKKIHVVHAGCNVVASANTERPMKRDFILFVGRDFRRKGGELLLDAFEHVRAHHDVDLVIAGPARWVRPGQIPAGVHLLGNTTPASLQPYFQHARLFVMPSYYEAFGIAFVEALCYGIPVIARNSCAMPEIVTHGANGFLLNADSESPHELADLVNSALASKGMKALAEQQSAQAREYYSWDRVARDMVRIIERERGRTP